MPGRLTIARNQASNACDQLNAGNAVDSRDVRRLAACIFSLAARLDNDQMANFAIINETMKRIERVFAYALRKIDPELKPKIIISFTAEGNLQVMATYPKIHFCRAKQPFAMTFDGRGDVSFAADPKVLIDEFVNRALSHWGLTK